MCSGFWKCEVRTSHHTRWKSPSARPGHLRTRNLFEPLSLSFKKDRPKVELLFVASLVTGQSQPHAVTRSSQSRPAPDLSGSSASALMLNTVQPIR